MSPAVFTLSTYGAMWEQLDLTRKLRWDPLRQQFCLLQPSRHVMKKFLVTENQSFAVKQTKRRWKTGLLCSHLLLLQTAPYWATCTQSKRLAGRSWCLLSACLLSSRSFGIALADEIQLLPYSPLEASEEGVRLNNLHNSRQQETVPSSTKKPTSFCLQIQRFWSLTSNCCSCWHSHYPQRRISCVKPTESLLPTLFWTELWIVLSVGESALVSLRICDHFFTWSCPCFQRRDKSTWITLSTLLIESDG